MKKRYTKPATIRANTGIAVVAVSIFVLGFGVLLSALVRADASAAPDLTAAAPEHPGANLSLVNVPTNERLLRRA